MKFHLHFYLKSPYRHLYKRTFYQAYPDCAKQDGGEIFLCDTDDAIYRLTQSGKHPVVAVSHPDNSSQELMKTPWLILSPDALTPDFLEEVFCRFHHIPLTIAETSRCLIRELSVSDLPFLSLLHAENGQNPEGCFFPADCGDQEKFLSDYIRCQYPFFGFGLYAITVKPSLNFIGLAGFSNLYDCGESVSSCRSPSGISASFSGLSGGETAEISYALLRRWRRRGYAKEVLQALMRYGETKGGFRHFIARIRPENTASLALAKKCGISVYFIEQRQNVRR